MRFRLLRHDIVDSTSERAFASLAAGKARHGDVHVARGQSAGRGRLGRRWESPPDEGLYLSVVLRPAAPPPPPALSMAGGLAVLEAVRDLGLAGGRLDWPNDLVLGAAKLAGVLVESRGLDPRAPHYVLGIGLNVRQRAFPEALTTERAVTSLALAGVDARVEEALAAVLARLAPRLDQALAADPDLAARFLEATGLAGRAVLVRRGREKPALRGVLSRLELEAVVLDDAAARQVRVPLALVSALEADPSAGRG